ncbi:MAG: recombinase family protein [Magnetococcales bacterium]|nr:recombinase family protein [Magnetococcales bacterium]
MADFAIYARKSNDEGSGKQAESIPQQLEVCFKFAENHNLPLAPRPEYDPYDESIIGQITDAFRGNPERAQRIIALYVKHWIISEQKSAKVPYRRERWSQLVEKIKRGKIKGLISYSPDRCARNLQEGGEIIQLWETMQIGLRFTTASFENNAAGHMMLGFSFVFAEHYSKKLSEDTMRGMRLRTEEGKASGVRKFGYRVDENDFFVPEEPYFSMLRKAFARKMYDRWSDDRIAKELNELGFDQQLKKNSPVFLTGKKLSNTNLWSDPFYYGVWERKVKSDIIQIDLRSLQCGDYTFEPLISEDEWTALQELLTDTRQKYIRAQRTAKAKGLDCVTPVSVGSVICGHCDKAMVFTIPNPSRHQKNMQKLLKSNPEATLAEIVNPHQIHFNCRNKLCSKKVSVTWQHIDPVLEEFFSGIKLSDEDYQAYLHAAYEEIKNKNRQKQDEQRRADLLFAKASSDEEKFLLDTNFGRGLTGKDKKIWEKKRDMFKRRLVTHSSIKVDLADEARDFALEQSAFLSLLSDLPTLWRNADYVRKRKICEIFISNIIFYPDKSHQIRAKAELDGVLSCLVTPFGSSSNILPIKLNAVPLRIMGPIVKIYCEVLCPMLDKKSPRITKKLATIYGLQQTNCFQ